MSYLGNFSLFKSWSNLPSAGVLDVPKVTGQGHHGQVGVHVLEVITRSRRILQQQVHPWGGPRFESSALVISLSLKVISNLYVICLTSFVQWPWGMSFLLGKVSFPSEWIRPFLIYPTPMIHVKLTVSPFSFIFLSPVLWEVVVYCFPACHVGDLDPCRSQRWEKDLLAQLRGHGNHMALQSIQVMTECMEKDLLSYEDIVESHSGILRSSDLIGRTTLYDLSRHRNHT